MVWIIEQYCSLIIENGFCFFKAYTMFLEILCCLISIPFKSH